MIPQHVMVGGLMCLLCSLLAIKSQWFLAHTRKGAFLTRQFGDDRAPWVLRGLALGGIVFGLLLALEVVRPIQW